MTIKKDAYEEFMNEFKIEPKDLLGYAQKYTIYGDDSKVEEEWDKLKVRIENGVSPVYIRGYGRDAKGTNLFKDFYQSVLKKANIEKDSSNNANPTKLIKELTGYSKQVTKSGKFKQIQNYQISHIFGKTKNIYTFTAPWNIVYMPKILDPLTGHESRGTMKNEFKKMFQEEAYDRFEKYIKEYNKIVTDEEFILAKDKYLSTLDNSDSGIKKFIQIINEEFSPILKDKLGTY